MAVGCGYPRGAGFRGGATLRLGLRTDRTGDTGADCSAEKTRCGGAISIRAESDVFGFFRGMDWALARVRTSEFACDRDRLRGRVGRPLLCAVL